MWNPFKKKEEKPVLEATLTMGELLVNPSVRERYARHASRIATIIEALKSATPEEAEGLKKELARRQLEIQLAELKRG